jgi:rRNA processing protein Krr1/Pno1
VEVRVPKAQHGLLLGKSANNVKRLEQETNTKISVPRNEESSDMIKISGNKDGVEMARRKIEAFTEDISKQAKKVLSDIDSEFHPFICGPNNMTIISLQESTGCRINIPSFNSGKDDIVVSGEKEGVDRAVTEIKNIYHKAKRNYTTVSVEVRKSQHRYVYGAKGQGIQEILEKTGVYVDVPPSSSNESTITLRGPQDKMGETLTLVYSKANSIVTEEVKAPSWLHRFIIGRGGENIKSITRDLNNVSVNFSRDEDTVIIEGPPEEVQLAKESLENFTEGLMATMTFVEVHIDQKYHSHIIGKKGSNVTKIKEETCTSISIPSDKQKNDVIRIEGDPQGVAAAKKMILEMASKLANESTVTIEIEQKWHKMVIGANGEHMKELRDRFPGVHVAFPEPGRRSNHVTLRGPTKDVDKCSEYLRQQAKDIVRLDHMTITC